MKKFFLISLTVIAVFTGCKKNEGQTPYPVAGPIETLESGHVTAVSATINGKFTPVEGYSYGFQYSKDAGFSPEATTTIDGLYHDPDDRFHAKLKNLDPVTTYYFRTYLRHDQEESYGKILQFTTKDISSLVTTLQATDIGFSSATLKGQIDPEIRYSFSIVEYGFYWGMYEESEGIMERVNDNEENIFTCSLSSLNFPETYWFKAYVNLDGQEYCAEPAYFDTVIQEAIDLGLSVKWRSYNLGASAPQESGYYYAWGDTEPYYSSLDPLAWKSGKASGYIWDNYKWQSNPAGPQLSKYVSDPQFGTIDLRMTLETGHDGDDAASKALGGNWRIPTEEEWQELIDNCEWKLENIGGVWGWLVSSREDSSKWIFLPRAGYFYEKDIINEGDGYYWTSGLVLSNPISARILIFDNSFYRISEQGRCVGLPIRPVLADTGVIPVQSVKINPESITIYIGQSYQLTAIITPSNATSQKLSWLGFYYSTIVDVSQNGVITGASPGKTIIFASCGGQYGICEVEVLDHETD